jgi:hypothetical protein
LFRGQVERSSCTFKDAAPRLWFLSLLRRWSYVRVAAYWADEDRPTFVVTLTSIAEFSSAFSLRFQLNLLAFPLHLAFPPL